MENTNTQPVTSANDAEQNKMMAVLAYILFLIPLLAAKESPFARYHTNQGLVLFLFGVIGMTLGGIIPVIGWCIITPIVSIAWLVLTVMGIINAVNLEMKPLPLIGGISLIK